MTNDLESPGILPGQMGEINVLVVEDNEVDRRQIKRLFERLNLEDCKLSEAATAEEAHRVYNAHSPNCILLVDLHLPMQNGLDFIDSLPTEPDGHPPEAIMFTGDDDPEVVVKAMRLGVRDFLAKSRLTSEALSQALGRAAERRRLRLELVRQREQLESQNEELKASQRALLNIMDDLEREIAQRRSESQGDSGSSENH